MRADADQRRLRGVADPAGPRESDVAADRQQQGEQQRLAAGAAHHLVWAGRQAAPGPVPGRRRPQRCPPGHRAVLAVRGRCGQRLAQHRVDRKPGLAEGQRQDQLPPGPPRGHGLVRGQRGRHRHSPPGRRRHRTGTRSWRHGGRSNGGHYRCFLPGQAGLGPGPRVGCRVRARVRADGAHQPERERRKVPGSVGCGRGLGEACSRAPAAVTISAVAAKLAAITSLRMPCSVHLRCGENQARKLRGACGLGWPLGLLF